MNYKGSLSAVMMAITLSACALTTDRIDIQYRPTEGVSPVPGAGRITVAVQVTDQRQDKTKIGSKKNGYGVEMAPILATEDVATTIQNAISRELRARGFQLGSKATVQVSVAVARFANDFKNGFLAGDAVADLIMGVSVASSYGKPLYSRQIVAQGVEPNVQLATGENAKLALDRALQKGIASLFEDNAFIQALLGGPSS